MGLHKLYRNKYSLKKIVLLLLGGLLALLCAGCQSQEEAVHPLDKEALEQLSGMLEGSCISDWMETNLSGGWSVWYEAYTGETLQRVAAVEGERRSPAVCSDIVFYRASDGETPEEVAKQMMDAMIAPLKEASENRSYTITEYIIEAPELIQAAEGLWLVPYIDGFYSYEGTDLVTMEEYLKAEPELERDGLMPFMRQGSADEFAYVLMKEGDVYRLQRAADMMK